MKKILDVDSEISVIPLNHLQSRQKYKNYENDSQSAEINEEPHSMKSMPPIYSTKRAFKPTPSYNYSDENLEWYEDIQDLNLFRSKYLKVVSLLEIGKRLRLQLEITATAIVIFHRFSIEMEKETFFKFNYANEQEVEKMKGKTHNELGEKVEMANGKGEDHNVRKLNASKLENFKSQDAYILISCIFLACKIGESPRRIRDVINVYYFTIDNRLRYEEMGALELKPSLDGNRVTQSKRSRLEKSEKEEKKNIKIRRNQTSESMRISDGLEHEEYIKIYSKDIIDNVSDSCETKSHTRSKTQFPILEEDLLVIKCAVIHYEQWILRLLSFDIEIFSPFRYMLNYAHSIQAPAFVVQLSWSLILESLASVDCLLYPPNIIAVCSLYLAIDAVKSKLNYDLQMKSCNTINDEHYDVVNVDNIMGKQKEIDSIFQGQWWLLFDVDHSQIEEWCSKFEVVYEKIKKVVNHSHKEPISL